MHTSHKACRVARETLPLLKNKIMEVPNLTKWCLQVQGFFLKTFLLLSSLEVRRRIRITKYCTGGELWKCSFFASYMTFLHGALYFVRFLYIKEGVRSENVSRGPGGLIYDNLFSIPKISNYNPINPRPLNNMPWAKIYTTRWRTLPRDLNIVFKEFRNKLKKFKKMLLISQKRLFINLNIIILFKILII